MRTPALIGIFGLGLVACEGVAFAQRLCPLDAVRTFRSAREAGFSFEKIASNATSCRLDESTITVSAPALTGAQCVYHILGRRTLAPGWRIQRLVISGAGVTDGPAPPPLPAAPIADEGPAIPQAPPAGWLVRVRVPAGTSRSVSIRRVVLFGPDCRKAAEAFE